jgi:TPR repeat protein
MITPDPVNHPAHYLTHRSGIECIQITEHLNFCLGNALKYIWRADEKGDAINDLAKAVWYLEREIVRRKALADIENARLLGVIADCLEKDLVTKTASSPDVTGSVLAYAQAGDARRQYEMGRMCFYGDGMPQDYEVAVEWWQKAAAQGNYEAQLALVNAYRKGEGVEKNGRLANYWLEQAGSQRTEEEAQ